MGARWFVALGLALLAVIAVQVGEAGAAEMPETARALVNRESTPLCAPECEAITAPSQAPDGGEYEGGGPGGGFTPEELREAYGVPERGGKGVTVAIVDDIGDPEAEYDLGQYREEFGLPPCTKADGCFRQVNEEGRAVRPRFGSWYSEIELDMDMVSAGCPECNILLLEGEGREGRMEAIRTAVEMGAAVVTNSWNFGFDAGNPANSAACLHEFCVTASEARQADEELNFPGVPILFSGGDYGYAVRFPASSPNVISVGGTALSRDAEGARGWHEETWFNSSYGVDKKGRGGGGGCAENEEKPAWETDPACPGRVDNDVAAVADPATPVAVYSAYSGWLLVGGTSASTPFVAGVEALSSPGSRAAGAAAFWSPKAVDSLFDVTEGQIGECTPPAEDAYWCTAEVGFDAPTGWGTPNGPLELPSPPLVTTEPVGSTGTRTAVLSARVDDEGVAGGAGCSFQVTTAADTSFATPVAEVPCEPNQVEASDGEVVVTATVTGLSPHASYIFRAVATNADGGPVDGGARSFTTPPEPPRASLEPALNITRHEAELRATVDNEGAPDGTSCAFEVTTDDDVKFLSPFETLPCEPGTISGEGAAEVGAMLTGLEQNSIYYYRVVVNSSGGTPPPSDPIGFRTLPRPPDATTGGVTEITSTGARLIGRDEDEWVEEGSSCVFEVAAIVDARFASPVVTVPCVSELSTEEDGFGVNALVSGLAPETGYRYRVEATNPGGAAFGDSETFETAPAPASPPAEIGKGSGGGVLVLGPPDEIEMKNPQATQATVAGPGPVTAHPPPPSNSITVGPARVHGESLLLTVTVPGPGTLSVGGGAVRSVADRSLGAGPVTVRVVLTKAAKRRASRRRLKMRLRVTFTPTGGTSATRSVTVVLGRSPSRG